MVEDLVVEFVLVFGARRPPPPPPHAQHTSSGVGWRKGGGARGGLSHEAGATTGAGDAGA